ncbi:hypothetical protein A2852_02750 [Candidatus Adlerbacteria bacterium RIFCSPHIGHO2_01_FULL_54_23]|nr:MAG: hypothetical protein A2852_02750 [Candidatus Adlerbacteria bacterium RIFCSPHIGHO2_01_FULL_54_23]OGC87185.1 MAG: hypothetical protein A3B33_01110 [Candidatus Adlerbacteria bacterium RIFCSPLOWO2_01_FULL_54_16]
MGFGFPLWIAPLFLAFILWSLFWKGLALWHSSRRGQNWWFIVMLVVNTAGILEIAYLFAIIKLKFGKLFNPEHRRSH